MTDRELLEAAAKAANVGVEQIDYDGVIWVDFRGVGVRVWNPLIDDGDALRLAVELGIKVTPYPIYQESKHSVMADHLTLTKDGTHGPQVIELYVDDPRSATRRAIVKVAAEIGEDMK